MHSIPKWLSIAFFLKIASLMFADIDLVRVKNVIFSGTEEETFAEEVANSLTHGFGTLLSIIALYYLIRLSIHYRKSWQHWLSLTVYGLSLVILYALSTTYHVAGIIHKGNPEVLRFYRVLDHIGIFYLIAGTYTPLMLLNLSPVQRNIMSYIVLGFVWVCAVTGTAFKLLVPIEASPLWMQVIFYLAMGFSVVFVIKPFLRQFPPIIIFWSCLGGFFYSFGVIFLLWDSLQFNHAIWHTFVMAGSASQFVGVLLSTVPQSSRAHLVDVAYRESRVLVTKILTEFESEGGKVATL